MIVTILLAFNGFFFEASTLDDRNAELPEHIMIFDKGRDCIAITLKDVCEQLSFFNHIKVIWAMRIYLQGFPWREVLDWWSVECKFYKMSIRLCKVAKTGSLQTMFQSTRLQVKI